MIRFDRAQNRRALLAGVVLLAAFVGALFFTTPARASSRPVNSREIRRAQTDIRRQYGSNYYMYGAIRTGQTYYRKGNRYYRVPGR